MTTMRIFLNCLIIIILFIKIFESFFIESSSNGQTSFVGEIYRIPNSYITSSIKIYKSILNKIQSSYNQVLIGTD